MEETLLITIVKNLKEHNEKFKYQDRRSEIIIHYGMWHFSSCKTIEQLNKFTKVLGIEYFLHEEKDNMKVYITNTVVKEKLFWELKELPSDVKKIKGLSNGSIVDCYFNKKENVLNVYRPNPNAKNVYKKMDFKKELEYRKENMFF